MATNATNAAAGGLRGLLAALWRIHARDESAVLGIVTATEGSTYQKPGALVLLDDKGLRHGVISGGCLEPALEHAARAVRESGRAEAVEFDTRSDEDLLFGSGIGCRGRVRLLLLPLPPRAPLARALFAALDRGVALQLAFVPDGSELGAGVALVAGESTAAPAARWNREGRTAQTQVAATLRIDVAAPPRLLLLGAGPETAPLAAIAHRLGWFIDVVEHRGRWTAFAADAAIDRLLELVPEAASAALAGERYDAMLAMSHNYSMDLAWLRFCATASAAYVGLLGPAVRRDALIDELGASARALLAPRLRAPVGLDLGGHGGEAVALAIAAQLQEYFSALRQAVRDAESLRCPA
ncbi:MAG: XdhC family protein [Rudaea sp.]|uniref:XdhC family protein n=1 Tax=Rudaea sp. TaxID=2136325 RepID=UPI0039E3C5DE